MGTNHSDEHHPQCHSTQTQRLAARELETSPNSLSRSGRTTTRASISTPAPASSAMNRGTDSSTTSTSCGIPSSSLPLQVLLEASQATLEGRSIPHQKCASSTPSSKAPRPRTNSSPSCSMKLATGLPPSTSSLPSKGTFRPTWSHVAARQRCVDGKQRQSHHLPWLRRLFPRG